LKKRSKKLLFLKRALLPARAPLGGWAALQSTTFAASAWSIVSLEDP
jgi:hypothetical protein